MFGKRELFRITLMAVLAISGNSFAGDGEKTWKDYFDVAKGGKLEKSNRVLVAGYNCAFVIQAGASAKSSDIMDKNTGIATASLNIMLGGIKMEDLQEIADSAYAAFLAQIKASGREVVSYDELKATKSYQKFENAVLEPGKIFTKQYKFTQSKTYVVISPKAIPLGFTHLSPINDRTAFGIGNSKALWAMADEVKAILVVPLITINFLNFEGSGRSLIAKTASVSANSLISTELGCTVYHFYGPSYSFGAATVVKPIVVDGEFGGFDESPEALNHFDIGSALISFDKVNTAQMFIANAPKFKEIVLQAHALTGKYFGQVLEKYKP